MSKTNAVKKQGNSPTSKYKTLMSRIRRAKAKEMVRKGEKPVFKKTDEWDWN